MNGSLLVILTVLTVALCAIPATERQGFLNAHNMLRSKISSGNYVAKGKKMPAAKTPIPSLVWDTAIENSAQQWANGCQFKHSQKKGFGENLYTKWFSAPLTMTGVGKEASNSWENEFQQYGWKDIKLTADVFNSGIGHATQMAWAKTTKIGCGIALCQGNKQVLVVCQYQAQGNMLNTNVYEPK